GRDALDHLPARHPAAVDGGCAGRGADRLHPGGGRLCHRQADGRIDHADDRQPGRGRDAEEARPCHGLGRRGDGHGPCRHHQPDLRALQPPLSGRPEMKSSPGLRSYAILYLVFLYGPILILPLFAFNDATIVSFPLSGVTTRWFGEMWQDEALWRALRTSLQISLSTAVIATALGVLAARAAVRYRWPGKTGVMGLILVPLVLPEIIVAMSM